MIPLRKLDFLKNCHYDEVPLFSLNGMKKIAKVVKVSDGDSIHIVCFFEGKLTRFFVRIRGIDTPELRDKDIKIKEFAYKVQNIVEKLILNKLVHVKFFEMDKYGRALADIYFINDNEQVIDIAKYLLQNKFAQVYTGGTKKQWKIIFQYL